MSEIENSGSFCLKTRILISLESNHFFARSNLFWLLILFYPALIALGGSVWLCVPLGHYTREALHQGTHVCPPPCAQMAGHKAILWQPHLVDRAKGPCPL